METALSAGLRPASGQTGLLRPWCFRDRVLVRALGSTSKLGPFLTAAAGETKMAALGRVTLTPTQRDQLTTLPNLQVQFPKPPRKFFLF